MHIAVLSPHRDDAAFSLSLSIAAWLEQGHRVRVIDCFTRSLYAPFASDVPEAPEARLRFVSDLRRHEDKVWQSSFRGALDFADLRLKDAPLRLGCDAAEVCDLRPDPADSALGPIESACANPAFDALLLPLGLGTHVDHVTARNAGVGGALEGKALAFYEDLPYATRPAVTPRIAAEAAILDAGLRPVFPAAATDGEIARERKLRMTRLYPTQIDPETSEAMADFCRQYLGRERLWANAAWCASPLSFEEAQR